MKAAISNIKPKKSKLLISEEWLKEDNIGKKGFIINPKDFKIKFND